ncbi:putative pentatricopeptide repeat-containing protein At5g40405 [Elaeis guineensis]|uniref:putative pentatricopeptide repeat-containing protein At5g40405 n=1 Tax=Elaeis guineensis var. tenera TaxID=51953 RepID=UPI003C6D0234
MNSCARNFQSFLSPDHLVSHLLSPPPTLKKLQQIQAQILTNPRLQSNPNLLSHFISHFIQTYNLSNSSLLLRHLPKPHHQPSIWNHLLRSSAESSPPPGFLSVYRAMLQENISPDRATFTTLLRHFSALPNPSDAVATLHCQIIKLGHASDRFLLTGLLNLYSKVGCLNAAEQLFVEMPERDVIANNAMIAALSSHGRIIDARRLFESMPEKSSASWNSMITCYCKQNDVRAAREIFDRNPIKDVVSWNAMIDGYCKMGQLEMAWELFDRMGLAKNSVTWNTVISACLHHREFAMALSMFQVMQVENVRPTEVTMVSLLSACAHLGALSMGRWLHAYIRNHRLKIDVVLGNALIDMYFKCGSVEAALQVFHGMSMKNVFCWNSVIAGLGMNGYGEQAIEIFLEMDRRGGFKPDGVTFVGLLSGCSHSGLVSEGKKYFSRMLGVYGIQPEIEHYGCMVDLLGRAGYVEEALNLIETMPIQPNSVVWGSLLRACRIHKDAKLSERVTQRLLELDPDDGANYVFLSNVYASSKRWDDVERCRQIMIERGVQKVPGCSSIEVNNMIHEFVVGDASHPQFEQINTFLVEIERELRKLGYSPSTDSVLHDIEDEEKENAVMYHSEKIAIAFGLMSTRGKEPIRVVKNLRVCSDCHEATKFIAKLFQREIIVRDRNRFHHFRDGTCSCKDYW